MKNLEFCLRGKVTLITGSTGGLGNSIADYFAAAGSAVFLSGRQEEKLKTIAKNLAENNVPVEYKAADIIGHDSCMELIDSVIKRMGKIDILVNCAGINRPENAVDVTEKNWNDIIDTNLNALFFLCQAAGKEMIKRGQGGKIVNISSQAGIVALPIRTAYCSSKAGVNQLTRNLAYEWAKYNINVNAVAPTFVETPFTEGMFKDKKFKDFVLESIPLGRMAKPEDVSYATLFLASDFANMVTGHILVVDGGWTIK
jgi:NAD(P)-dependent dehydrogenase (short-subunit alcohol dehydrogenase family)